MDISYYPSKPRVEEAIRDDEPLLVLISFDNSKTLVSPIDESMEHHIVLKQLGLPETDIDAYFRIVLNKSGADWTFVCPSNYKGIADKFKRIEIFYNDGFKIIPKGLAALGYQVELNIPTRYQRHFKTL